MERICRLMLLATIATLCIADSHGLAQAQTQVNLTARKDNTLYESANGSTSNGAGEALFVGRTGQLSGSIRRGLLAFPIGDSIAVGSTVVSVTLTLHMSRTSLSAPTSTIELHRLLEDWGEGNSNAFGNEGTGAPADTNDATWTQRFLDSVAWTNPGGDFDPQSSATQAVSDTGFYLWGPTSQLVSEVQQWVNDPASNFGWLMIGNEANSFTSKRFDSKENIDPAVRPRLTVTYLPAVSGVEKDGPLPVTPALQQNYPNPFNPRTEIRSQMPEARHVRLVVYDMLGREVATLVDERRAAGSYADTFDASNLASGVYIYRLTAGSFVLSRKMILMK